MPKASSTGTSIPLIPEGVHVAVCVAVVDLGTHHDDKYNKDTRKVLIQWELPGESRTFQRDGVDVTENRIVSKTFACSLHEKANLRKYLEAWRGKTFTADELKGFELSALLGKGCQMQIVHAPSKSDPSKIYANIAAIMAMPKGLKAPATQNKPYSYDIPATGITLPSNIPQWIAELLCESAEFKAANIAPPARQETATPATTQAAKPQPAPATVAAVTKDEEETDDIPF